MSTSPSEPAQGAGTVRANLLALGAAEAVARLAQLVAIGLLGRVLGPEGVGVVGIGWAVFQLAVPFVQYAPDLMGTRNVARGDAVGPVYTDLTAIKLMISLLAGVAILVAAPLLFGDDRPAEFQTLAQIPLLVVVALNGVWAFRGLRRFTAYAVVRCVSSLALLACLAVVLLVAPAPWAVPLSETVTALAAALVAYTMLLGLGSLPSLVPGIVRRAAALSGQVSETVQFGLGSFFAGAIWSLPLLVAHNYLDPAEQGLLAAALRLILAVSSLFQLALQVFHPVLASRYQSARESGRSMAAALVVYAFVTTIPASLALVLLSPWIVGPMLGSSFESAAIVLAVLAPTLIPTTVGSVFGYALMADGRYRLYVLIQAGGAAASAVGCGVAFSFFPEPAAVAILSAVMTIVAVVGAIVAWRLDLVHFAQVSWRQLSPARIGAMLRER